MSVLLKGMKMPKEGMSVVIDLWNNGKAYVYGTGNAEMYDAVELPDHGDLIDRDALLEEAKILGTVTCHQPFDFPYGCNLVEWCKLAKTVIPAERSEEGSLCGECDRMYTQDCCYCERMERSEE